MGLARGRVDYQRFVIFSNYRCGSNFLMNLLKSHPQAVCYSEIFYLDRIYWASKVYGKKVFDSKLLEERDADEVAFLEKYIYRKYHRSIDAVGYKLHYKDMHRHDMKMLSHYLPKFPRTKVIHLKRPNHLERYLSTIVLQKTDTAVMVNAEEYRKKLDKMNQVELDPEICRKEFEWRQSEFEVFDNLLKQLNADVLNITYDDLMLHNSQTMKAVMEFVGLEPIQLETHQKKQNTKSKRELISNYEALKQKFSDTQWAWMFDE